MMSDPGQCSAIAATTGRRCKRQTGGDSLVYCAAHQPKPSDDYAVLPASSGVALLLGCAETVWDDVKAAERLVGAPSTIIAVNDAGADYPSPVDHWVSLHPEQFSTWRARRVQQGYPMHGTLAWSRRNPEFVDCIMEHWGKGTSGLYAVTVARYLGFEKIILCGITIDKRPHYHDGFLGRPWKEYPKHRPGWEQNLKRIARSTRSMSGWTRDLLGAPTKEWLRG